MNRGKPEVSPPSHQDANFENVSEMANSFDQQVKDILNNERDQRLLPRRLREWGGMTAERTEAKQLVEGLRRSLQRSLDRYLNTELTDPSLNAICVVSYIAENLPHHSMSPLLLEQLAPPLLDIASVQIPQRILYRVLTTLNFLIKRTPRPVCEALFPKLKLHIRGVASWLVHCGDYQTQACLLVTLVHLVPSARAQRVDAARAIFRRDLSEEAFEIFFNRDFSNLEMHTREFLHMVNAGTGLVVHVLCEAILLDGVPLLGVNKIEGDPMFMELNKVSGSVTVDCCNFTLRANAAAIQHVRMLRDGKGKAVIEIIAPLLTQTGLSRDGVSMLKAYPSVRLAMADATLREMYGDRYKCEMVINKNEDWNTRPRMPSYLEVGTSLSWREMDLAEKQTPELIEETVQPARRSYTDTLLNVTVAVFHRAEARSRSDSRSLPQSTVSSTSTTSLLQLRQKCENYENAFNIDRHKKKQEFTAILAPLYETSVRGSMCSSRMLTRNTKNMNQNINEVSDIQLVNDLYEAALRDSFKVQEYTNKQNSIKDEGTFCGEKISKKTQPTLKGKGDNIMKQLVSTKVRMIEEEAILNKENSNINIQTDENLLKAASNQAGKPSKGSTVTKTDEVTMILSQNQSHNRQDTITAEASIEDSTNDYISDTPNVVNTLFQNISSKKKSDESPKIMAQSNKSIDSTSVPSSKRTDSKFNKTVQKKSVKNYQGDCPLGSTNLTTTRKVSTTTISSMSQSSRENPSITDDDSRRKRRKLYSPKSDFLQNNVTENCENDDSVAKNSEYSEIEKKRTEPNSTPVVVLEKKQYKDKTFYDKMFDQLSLTNNETQKTINPTVSTKRSQEVYNLSSSDSEYDFKIKKSLNTNSIVCSKAAKPTPKKRTKRSRNKHTKKSKKSNKLEVAQETTNISIPIPILTDEKMRREVLAEDLLNVSFENKAIPPKNIDKEDILPVGLDTIEIQDIQHSDDKSLKPNGKEVKIKCKSHKDNMDSAGLDTTVIPEITHTSHQSKTSNSGYQSLKPKDRSKEVNPKSKVDKASVELNTIEIQDIPHISDHFTSIDTGYHSQSKRQSEKIKKKDISYKEDMAQKSVHNKDCSKNTETLSQSLRPIKPEAMKKKCEPKTKAKVKVEQKTIKKKFDEFSNISSTPPPLFIELEELNKVNDLTSNFNAVVEHILSSVASESEAGIKEKQIMNDIMLPQRVSSSSVPKTPGSIVDLVTYIDNDAQQFSSKTDVLESSHKSIEFDNDVSQRSSEKYKRVKRSCLTVESSPRTASDRQSDFPTVRGSPITAHVNAEEEPPEVALLDERVQGRNLETEMLDSRDRYFIEKLRELESLSAEGASDVVISEARESSGLNSLQDLRSSTPKKSSNNSQIPLNPYVKLTDLTLIKLPVSVGQSSKRNVDEGNLILKSTNQSYTPTVKRRAESQKSSGTEQEVDLGLTMRSSSPSQTQPTNVSSKLQADVQSSNHFENGDSSSNNTREWIRSHPSDSEQTQEFDMKSSILEVCQLLVQSIGTGFAEDSRDFNIAMVSGVARLLEVLMKTEHTAKQQFSVIDEEYERERKRVSQQLDVIHEEYKRKRRSVYLKRNEQYRRSLDAYKECACDVMRQHARQGSTRVNILKEDVQRMLRRYQRSTGHDIRLRTAKND